MSEEVPTIYQFRLTVAEISPLIWRRVWMRADQTLADLHYTIQITMDWTASYLNEFLFRGRRYSVSETGVAAVHEASCVVLDNLCLRPNECIQYRYNMYVPWRVQIRYEKAVPYKPECIYPYCVSGKHPGPIEQYSDADEYQDKRDRYSEAYFGMILLNALVYQPDQTVKEVFGDEYDLFNFWIREHRFNRKHVNEILKTYSVDGEWWVAL